VIWMIAMEVKTVWLHGDPLWMGEDVTSYIDF